MAPNPSSSSSASSRKPLPQPVEETTRSHRSSSSKNAATAADSTGGEVKPHRALPQPVETSSKTSKKGGNTLGSDSSRDPNADSAPSSSSATPTKSKKFAPQMIETSRRSRRNTDTSPCVTPSDKTDFAPDKLDRFPKHIRPGLVPVPPENSPAVSREQVPQAPESKFSAAKLAAKTPRSHSFRVPDLPAIPSTSETTESNDSDTSRSPGSSSTGSDHTAGSRKNKHKRRSSEPRPGQDERVSGFLLSLAARAAERQLQEQAMAAYPNEHVHEPVDHYAIESDTEDSSGEEGEGRLSHQETDEETPKRRKHRRSHRESSAGWDLAEMRQHQKKLEEQRREAWAAGEEQEQSGALPGPKKATQKAPQGGGGGGGGGGALPPQAVTGWQKDNEIKSMRNAASPPMAGANLRFPRCESPRNTRLDVYQYPGQRKPSGTKTREHSGLWTPGGGASGQGSGSGLWMGVNLASAQPNHQQWQSIQTGLMTPAVERGDPFSASPRSSQKNSTSDSPSAHTANKISYLPASSLPPSPPPSQEEEALANKTSDAPNVTVDPPTSSSTMPEVLDKELDDMFVTQLYNYLSLGYPSLARPYDEELAKISQTPLDTIRKDDEAGDSRGYIGAPEGTTGLDMRGCREGKCQRWLALRAYVKEWGRQQVKLKGIDAVVEWGPIKGVGMRGGEGWGAAARKGSWAF